MLKKLDMLRKNDIDRILAERNILITVRNPFVVISVSNLIHWNQTRKSELTLFVCANFFANEWNSTLSNQ